jgi:hypothetical protein
MSITCGQLHGFATGVLYLTHLADACGVENVDRNVENMAGAVDTAD